MHIRLRQPDDATIRFAEAHKISASTVDGNDVVAVSKSVENLVKEMRNTNRPAYIEAVTYRWRGHVGLREDLDVGVKRSDDLNTWKRRDPIDRLFQALQKAGILSLDQYEETKSQIKEEIIKVWAQAERSPHPSADALKESVFATEESLV